MHSSRQSKTAFTLIELLVVVAIIAILMAILLPALQAARQQGKMIHCLANLRSIGTAANVYLADHIRREDFPWLLPSNYQTADGVYKWRCQSSFIWGGGLPDKTYDDWKSVRGTGMPDPTKCDVYTLPPKYRPINRYISNDVSWSRPGDIPGVFKCPSDSSPSVPIGGGPNMGRELDKYASTWEFWGTSYAINQYWADYHYSHRYDRGTRVGKNRPYNGNGTLILGGSRRGRPPGLGNAMIKARTGRWSSEFILFFENRLNFAFPGAAPRGIDDNRFAKSLRGWHRKMNYHAAVFLDGHAQYKRYDTRFVDGPGWTIWPGKPWIDDWAEFNDK